MKIRATNIMLIVIAILIITTACTRQEVPTVTEDQLNTETLPISTTESVTSTPEDESLLTTEDELLSTEEDEAALIPEDELSSTPIEEPVSEEVQSEQTVTTNNNYDEYFSNSVFVGDSVMAGLAQYIRGQRKNGVSVLSDAQFLTSVMGIKVADVVGDSASDNRRYYTYRGIEQPLETILNDMGAERVFIMLGMNDLGVGFSTDETIERYRRMIPLIKEVNPGLDVVVMTTTPKTATKWLPNYIPNRDLGSPLLNELADKLIVMCEEEGINVIDVNAAVRGPDGHLPNEYSRDDFVHINDKCSAVVLETLRQFAKIQLGE